MPRFCANLTWMFNELPLLDRFGAAKSAGFDAVEVLFPYDCPAPDMLDRLAVNDLTLALINCPPPNYAGGLRAFRPSPAGKSGSATISAAPRAMPRRWARGSCM